MQNPPAQIRVIHIIPDLDIGGAEIALYKLLTRTDKYKISPSVICLGNLGVIGRDIEGLGIPVYNLRMQSRVSSLLKIRDLIRLLRTLSPDIIQGWMYHGNLLATFVSFFLHRRICVLWNIRGPGTNLSREFSRMAVYWLTGFLSRFPFLIINNSRASAGVHERNLNYPNNKWVFIPNGFNTDVFKPDPVAREDLRNLLHLTPDYILIGHVARYDPMKDHRTFLAAAALLVQHVSNVRLVMIGPSIDQSNSELVQMISQFGLQEHVHLLGMRRNIPSLVAGFDIGCSSSYGEGFPNVVGEMMSCGVPCVVTDVGESAWIVGDAGKVVPARDPVSLAEALKELIDIGHEARCKLGYAARRRVMQNFSLDGVAIQYERLYLQVALLGRGHFYG